MESKIEGNAIGIENPFTLKVGQVFTGFGIGCGVGIGVGRPLNLGIFLLFSSNFFHIMDFGKNFFKPKTPQNSTAQKPCISLFIYLLISFYFIIKIEIVILLLNSCRCNSNVESSYECH
jgi:hypothetical protein